MMSAKDKYEYYDNLKEVLQNHDFIVGESSEISYGLQFEVGYQGDTGLSRIYESKKGIRLDLSQIKSQNLLARLNACTNAISAGKDAYGVNDPGSLAHSFPDEIIGVDESGKGDYFGPLVVAAVYVDKRTALILRESGVDDSKKLTDRQVEILSKQVKEICPYSVVVIGNARYNELYKKIKNLNKLLAWGHARAIENILEKTSCNNALSDQFGDEQLITKALLDKGKAITLYQMPKAEQIVAVAAASIIARNEYVARLRQLTEKYGVSLPKGASSSVISTAREFISKYSKNDLIHVAKLHFKTTEQL